MPPSSLTPLQQALHHAPGGLLTLSDDGQVVFANDRLHQWVGAAAGSLTGRPAEALWSPDTRALYKEQLLASLKLKGSVDELSLSLQTAAGEQLPIILSATRDTSGAQPLSHCVLMTSWRLQQVQQAAVAREERLAEIAHDLRTPLSAILGWVRVARSGKLESTTLQKALDTIERSAKEQTPLIQQLVDDSFVPPAATDSAPVTAAQAEQRQPPREKVSIKGVRVLVVDDDRDARGLLKALLEGAGATVSTAASSEEALDRLALERVPDVLLSDVGMPGRDGFALIREVRASQMPWSKTIAAIAVTGRARPQDRVDLLRAGFQAHLCKPVEPAEVVAMVKALARPG